MTDDLIDLGVLSVTASNNIELHQFLEPVKSIMPDYWTPTNDVRCATIIQLTDLGYLKTKTQHPSMKMLILTESGWERLSTLFHYLSKMFFLDAIGNYLKHYNYILLI